MTDLLSSHPLRLDFGVPPFQPDPHSPRRTRVHPHGLDIALQEIPHPVPQFDVVDGSELDGTVVYTARVEPGRHSTDLWRAFRELYPRTGLWPMISTPYIWPRCFSADLSPHFQIQSLTDVDGVLTGQHWLEQALASVQQLGSIAIPRGYEQWTGDDLLEAADRFRQYDWAHEWNLGCEAFDQLILVPTPNPHLVPGRLGWSGASLCEFGWRDHAAMLRRYQGLWHAEPIAIDERALWLRHTAPILDRPSALTAALEVFLYSSDVVFEEGHLDGFAKSLLDQVWTLTW